MPKYVYQCMGCKAEFEITAKMGEAPESFNCECGFSAVRIYTPTAAIFNGSGFYSTDKRKR